MNFLQIILLYLLVVNILGFALMGIDKLKARRQLFRIPESTLFLTAIIGGSIGSLAGMYLFRHKTLQPRFVYGMPVILILQIAFLIWLYYYSPFTFIML